MSAYWARVKVGPAQWFWVAWNETTVQTGVAESPQAATAEADAAMPGAHRVRAAWAKRFRATVDGVVVAHGRDAKHAHDERTAVPSCLARFGLDRTATRADLRRAYRQRAHETHPDHDGDADAFRAVRDAYEQARRWVRR